MPRAQALMKAQGIGAAALGLFGKTPDALARDDALLLARQAAIERRQLGAVAADLIHRFASLPAIGLIRLDPRLLSSDNDRASVYALRILWATTGGVAFLPDQTRSEALFGRLKAGFLCATLSRSVVDCRREARGLPPAAAVTDNAVWDGRR
eukprot:gene54842-75140_t